MVKAVRKLSNSCASWLASLNIRSGGLLLMMSIISLSFTFTAYASDPWAEFEQRRRAVGAKMEAATVWIVTEGWCYECDQMEIHRGTGFLVGDGYIATNAHVIDGFGGGGTFYILNEKISSRQATLINWIRENHEDAASGRDLALLRFDPPRGVELPILSFNFDVQRMDRVSSWGYPGMVMEFDISAEHLRRGDMSRLEPAPVMFTEGTVNAIVRDRLGTSSIIHSAAIAGGNSGGPLVNSRGEVVGMNTWGYTEEGEGAFLNGAQLSGEIVAFLAASGVAPRLAPGQQLMVEVQPRRETSPAPPTVGGRQQPLAPPPAIGGLFSPGGREDRRRDVGSFSVMVPRGWSVFDEERDMIIVGSDDDTAAVAILMEEIEGSNLRQVARDLSRELGGTAPELDDDIYIFTYLEDGVESMAFVGEGDYEGQFVFIFVSGDAANPGVMEVLNSVDDGGSASAPAPGQALIGTWAWDEGEDYLYTFNGDGTGTRGIIGASGGMQTFTWSIPEAGYLRLEVAGFGRESWSYTISGRTLTIDNRQVAGMTFSYIRR